MNLAGFDFAGFKFCWIQDLLDSSFAGFNFCWSQDLLDSIMSLRCRLVGFPGAECFLEFVQMYVSR